MAISLLNVLVGLLVVAITWLACYNIGRALLKARVFHRLQLTPNIMLETPASAGLAVITVITLLLMICSTIGFGLLQLFRSL